MSPRPSIATLTFQLPLLSSRWTSLANSCEVEAADPEKFLLVCGRRDHFSSDGRDGGGGRVPILDLRGW